MQNLKNFLVAYITGLIIFGVMAVLLINFGLKTVSEEQDESQSQKEPTQIEQSVDEM